MVHRFLCKFKRDNAVVWGRWLTTLSLFGMGRGLESVLNIVQIRLYSEHLSLSEVGKLSLILTLIGFVPQLLIAPTGAFILRQAVEWRREDKLWAQMIAFMGYLLMLVPIAAVTAYLARYVITDRASFSFLTLFLLTSINLVLVGIAQNFTSTLNILGFSAWFVVLTNVALGLGIVAALLLVHFFAATAVLWQTGILIGPALVAPVSCYLIWRIRKPVRIHRDKAAAPTFFSSGGFHFIAPLIGIAFCSWIQLLGYRVVLIDRTTAELLGIFTVGFTMGTLPVLLITKISNDYFVPIFFRKIAHRDKDTKVLAWNGFALHYCAAGLIAAPIIGASAHFYSRFLVAPVYWNYAWLAWFGAIYQLLFTFYSAYNQLAQAMMNSRTIVWPNIISCVMILIGMFIFTPLSPLVGAGSALLVGGVTLVLPTAFVLNRRYGVHLPWSALVRASLLGAAGASIILGLGMLFPSPTVLKSFFAIGLAGVLLLGLFGIFLWKYPPDDGEADRLDSIVSVQ